MVQKKLSGELVEWHPETRMLRVAFRKWWKSGRCSEGVAPFLLDPYAIVTTAYRGSLRLSELAVGQWVTLTYLTGPGGRPIAKTLTVSTVRKASRWPLTAHE